METAEILALRQRLTTLGRARSRQALFEAAGSGLFFGLLAACACVLAVRMAGHGQWTWQAALLPPLAGAVVLAAWAWSQRDSLLRVAIQVDRKLSLNERLSTAWEYCREVPVSSRARALARLAMRARVPARAHLVFPLRLSVPARFVPVALAALAISVAVDIDPSVSRDDDALLTRDREVRQQGQRLQQFARHMAADAAQHSLPHSARGAERMQDLATRMRSGAFGREEALGRLRDLSQRLDDARAAALNDAAAIEVRSAEAGQSVQMTADPGGSLRDVIARVLSGEMDADEARRLGVDRAAISSGQISSEQLERALKAHEAGDSDALRQLLQQLPEQRRSSRRTNRRDADLLERARAAVERAREQLGADDARTSAPQADAPSAASDGMGPAGIEDEEEGTGESAEGGGSAPARGLSQPQLDAAAEAATRQSLPESDPTIALQADVELNEGDVFQIEARVLPRMNESQAPQLPVNRAFERQLEAVLSRQQVPVRHKTMVRDYFNNLSTGAAQTR